MKTFKQTRNVENVNIASFPGEGAYDMPIISPVTELPEVQQVIGFNEALVCRRPVGRAVHFFLDDYQFVRVWKQPTRYVELLKSFDYVFAPDFSLFVDYPVALQMYSQYRKHWCARYWQANGLTVVPVINWAYESSYDWCFDGEPEHSIVAVSSVGVADDERMVSMFRNGYREMLNRLEPLKVMYFGKDVLGDLKDDRVQFCTTSSHERISYLRTHHAARKDDTHGKRKE